MIESWPEEEPDTTLRIQKDTRTRYVLLELETVLHALTHERVDKVEFYTEYGKFSLYSGETPRDLNLEMWAWHYAGDYEVARCRVEADSLGIRRISVYGVV